jgi:hypothetical protein
VYQAESGLAYNWHRTYDPTTGSYTQPDPLGLASGAFAQVDAVNDNGGSVLQASVVGLRDPAAPPFASDGNLNTSRYAYANNDPLQTVDPSGLQVAIPDLPLPPLPASDANNPILWLWNNVYHHIAPPDDASAEPCPDGSNLYNEEHTKNARPSTEEKHQAGQARKTRDYGGEKADQGRRPPRQKPPGWKGPWPPTQ